MTPLALLQLTALGAVCGLDVVSFPQMMISRPIIAATVAGAAVGAPARGLLIGALLELFALESLPFGASRYPEWGSAGVVGGALYGVLGGEGLGAIGVACCAAVLAASLGGWSMVRHRMLMIRWAHAASAQIAAGSPRAVNGLQLRGIAADLVRGGLVTAACLVLGAPLSRVVNELAAAHTLASRPVALVLAGAVAGSAVWKVTHTTAGARWYFVGGLVSAAAVVILR